MPEGKDQRGIRVGNVSGEVVIGDNNAVVRARVHVGAASAADRDALAAVLAELRARIAVDGSGDPARARERLDEFEAAVTASPPDVSTMVSVRNWFRRHLPLAGKAVSEALVHPAVAAVVAAAGQDSVRAFEHLLAG
jgi:hypothetical protein